MNIPVQQVRDQITSVLTAWGMEPEAVRITVEAMVETDLAGIDSHGISMLMLYEQLQSGGQLNPRARPKIVRQTAATALIDADAGLGHPASVMAMRLAMDKAGSTGLGMVSVCNSSHFGAAGYYAALAPKAGMIGIVTSSTRTMSVVPTRASVPVLGTNPIAFAAPGRRNRPFLLDMSTSTVAANKVKVYDLNRKALPSGWVLDENGRPVNDSAVAMENLFRKHIGGLTPVGGTPEMGSHKGYGLGVMVQILAATLGGASFSPIRNRTQKPGEPDDIGHSFMAIDPKAFRPEGGFEEEVDALVDFLHTAKPSDPGTPVLVAGDPETAARERRLREGIPIPPALADQIRAICGRGGARFVLEAGVGDGLAGSLV